MYRTLCAAAVLLCGCGSLKTQDELGQTLGLTGPDCSTNVRPTVTFDPVDATHPADQPLTFTVTDDQQAPETLAITLTSDVDGTPDGALIADATGRVEIPIEWLSPGDQALTVEVVDSCGSSSLATLGTCLDAEIHNPAVDLSTLRLSGDAIVEPGWLDLTPQQSAQVGSAFADQREIPAGEIDVRVKFTLGPNPGGDGMSITAADADRLYSWHGGGGCGLGYGVAYDCQTGIPIPGWSLELDTWTNDHDPIDGPHVAFTLDGQMDDPVAWAPIPDIGGLGWHNLQITVSNGLVVVRLDGNQVLTTNVDPSDLDFPAYIGFTASTGNQSQLHRIQEVETTFPSCL